MGTTTTRTIRTAHERLVAAPLDLVWQLQTDVERWPDWQPPVLTSQRLDDGDLHTGSSFRWSTPVPASDLGPADTLVVTSTVAEVEAPYRIHWSGPAVGNSIRVEDGVHEWTFTAVEGGTLVRTEETWTGGLVEDVPEVAAAALAASLEAWLDNLSVEAERVAVGAR